MTAETSPAYHREAAASHMVANIPRAHIDTPVGKVIEALRGHLFDCADTVFVTNGDGHLMGIVRINDLFGRDAERIGDIMEEEHDAVLPGDDQESITRLAVKLNMIAVPVVDDLGRCSASSGTSTWRICRGWPVSPPTGAGPRRR